MPKLAVVCAYFNPCRYQSRRRNFDEFRRRMELADVRVLTVELVFDPLAESELGDHGDVLCVRGGDVMWQKERLLQIGLDRLLADGSDAIAWADADIVFEGQLWAERIVRALEQFDCVQSFESLVSHYLGGRLVRPAAAKDHRSFAHGGSWAARADFWRRAPLYQHCIVGGGDSLAANAWLQCGNGTASTFTWPEDDIVLRQFNPTHRGHAMAWARRIGHHFQLGYVADQTAHLLPHGSRGRRYYLERWRAIAEFDPEQDVEVCKSGAFRWATDKPALHHAVRRYFEARREDE